MPKHWSVEGQKVDGSTILAAIESNELETAEEAKLFGAGQLRGMGFVVVPTALDVTVRELTK